VSKKNKKKDFDPKIPVVTQPHIESFVYGFLQSRGFDLYPRIRETKEGYLIALYFDRGEKGWWRAYQFELGDKEDPAHFALAVALVNHLYSSGVQPRTPAPMGEIACKMLRNEILGQLQDGINNQTAVGLLNNIAGTMTRHLRPFNMDMDFGDAEPAEEPAEDELDPEVEAEIDALEKAIEEEDDEGAGEVAEGESLEDEPDNVVELPTAEPKGADEVFEE
jgi:hypothetical protein